MPRKKHDWNNLGNYIAVHESVLKKYAACFANHPRYTVTRVTELMIELTVTIRFLHRGLKLDIRKTAETKSYGRGLEVARTYSYRYAAYDKLGCVFRYCSPHESHNIFHHKHVYDPLTRRELTPPRRIGDDEYPHVHEIFEELLAL